MKLNEIHSYSNDPKMNTFAAWATPIIHELSDVLGDWEQKSNTIRFELGSDDEDVTFRFTYNQKKTGHKQVGAFLKVSAHSVAMEVRFAPQKMNLAALHDDPEIQKKLSAKMSRPFSYFESHSEDLDEIIHVMKAHGADACSANDHVTVDMDNPIAAHNKLSEIASTTTGGHYGDTFRLDFLFLTEPLPSDEAKTP